MTWSSVTHADRAFADTSAYFALAYQPDAEHTRALAQLDRLATARVQLVTTNFVLAELHALLLARTTRQVARRVLEEVMASHMTTVVRVRRQDEDRAWAIIARYDDKDFSLTDAISFAVMERLSISGAFTFDQHFAQFGWQLLPALNS